MTEEEIAWIEGLYRGHEKVASLCAEVRRLQNALEWYDAMLLRVCDHVNELNAEIREGRQRMAEEVEHG